jgi:hypothetical protein
VHDAADEGVWDCAIHVGKVQVGHHDLATPVPRFAEGSVEAGYGHLGAMVAAEAKLEVGIDTSGFSCLLEPVGDDSSD